MVQTEPIIRSTPFGYCTVEFNLSAPAVRVTADQFVLPISGNVIASLASSDDDSFLEVGYVRATLMRIGDALDTGISAIDVLDAISEETAECVALFDRRTGHLRESVSNQLDQSFTSDVLLVERLQIAEEHRGYGLGLLAMRAVINAFAHPQCLVVCKPFPLQFAGQVTRVNEREAEIAQKKVGEHWQKVGFQRVPRSELLVLSTTQRLPDLERLLS